MGGCSSSYATIAEETSGDSALQENVGLDGSDLPDHVLSLTFDDGPGRNTEALASYLHDEGIAATFFVIGNTAKGHEDVLAKVRSLGHLVGNHTLTHTPMTSSPDPVGEVAKTDAIIAPFVTDGMFLFRAPQGKWNAGVATELNAAGLERYVGHVHWTAGGRFSARTSMDWNCWRSKTAVAECGRGYLNEVERARRGIVLMHDIHDTTFELVRWLVPRLRARGFGFARLDASPAIAATLRGVGGRPSAVAQSAPPASPPKAAYSASPFELASLARRGYLRDEGIPAEASFCDALTRGSIDAATIADAAVYSGRVSAKDVDGSYLNALSQLVACGD